MGHVIGTPQEADRLRRLNAQLLEALKKCRAELFACAEEVACHPSEAGFRTLVAECDAAIAAAEGK